MIRVVETICTAAASRLDAKATRETGGDLSALDDPQIYRELDPSGMAGRLSDAPRQVLAGWSCAWATPLGGLEGIFDHLVIAGMGGSAIAGDLVADLASLKERLPVTVIRDFRIPFTLNERTLMVACSYSGNTEETLSMFRQSLDSGARLVAVTAGGGLAQEAARHNVPALFVDAPGEPRSAAVYNFMLMAGLLARLGLLDTEAVDAEAGSAALAKRVGSLSPDTPTCDNAAKTLALGLVGHLPLVCGGGLFRGVARRWKSQLNENSKVWAFSETLPELLHNFVEAFDSWPTGIHKPMALLLKPRGLSDALADRYEALQALLERLEVKHQVLAGCDASPLVQLLDMLVLGDYVSYYLALLRGIDPSPTPTLDSLKRRTAGIDHT